MLNAIDSILGEEKEGPDHYAKTNRGPEPSKK